MTLSFTVANRRVRLTGGSKRIVCDNTMDTATFSFDSEWNALVKTARFTTRDGFVDVPLVDDSCEIPRIRTAGRVEVGVYGGNIRSTANADLIAVESVLTRGGIPSPPVQDVYSKIIAMLGRGSIESAVINGEGDLIITFGDGSQVNAGTARGVVSTDDFIDLTEAQTLTETQKTTARTNIGAPATQGYYPGLSVGMADGLRGVSMTTDLNFVMRKSASNDDKANRTAQIESVKGNTLVWNQLVDSDTASVTLAAGHRYVYGDNGTFSLLTPAQSTQKSVTGGEDMLFDLTKMFGAGNEPSAAEFRLMFPDTSYAYDAGTLRNLHVAVIKSRGFNSLSMTRTAGTATGAVASTKRAFDDGCYYAGLFTDNYFDADMLATGEADTSVTVSTLVDGCGVALPFRCFPSTEYCLCATVTQGTSTMTAMYYKQDGAFISSEAVANGATFTTPQETYRCLIHFSGVLGTQTVYTNINVNISHNGARDGEYESYTDMTRAIPASTYFPTGMKRAGSVYDELTSSKAITRVATRAYTQGDENDAAVTTDGTNTNYSLATPTETAISPALNLSYTAFDGGTEEAVFETGSSSSPLAVSVRYGQSTSHTLLYLGRDYISKSSFDNLADAISDVLNIAVTASYNSADNDYDFTVTDNRPSQPQTSGIVAYSATAVDLTPSNTWNINFT